jgi:hypothetical protein
MKNCDFFQEESSSKDNESNLSFNEAKTNFFLNNIIGIL